MEVVRIMLKSREAEMNDAAWGYMFIAALLPEDDYNKLREKWDAEGGHKVIPWWLFVSRNTKVELK